MGRWDEAIENMNRVIELQPKSTIHRFDLAQDNLYIRNYARAEVLFDRKSFSKISQVEKCGRFQIRSFVIANNSNRAYLN